MSTAGRSGKALLKQGYVTALRSVGKALTAVGLAADEAPPIVRRWAHWRHSLTKVYDSLAMARMDVPWWTYDAIAEVEGWLAERSRPIRAYEYGSGASTIWLSRRVDEVISVEHHREFGEMMIAEVAGLPNVALRVVEPVAEQAETPAIGSAKEGHEGLDFTAYVNSIGATTGDFDLIVIDGRAREACLTAALPRLAADGLIVFDNSRRARYAEAIRAAGVQEQVLRGLTPTLPYPEQTSLLRHP